MDKILEIQNLELLNNIANDHFHSEEDRIKFINNYYKINFRIFKIINKNNIPSYIQRINKLLK